MKTPILRKPKFMRNDVIMRNDITVATYAAKLLNDPDITEDQRHELMCMIATSINSAAKYGGFFSTGDFIKWLESQK
jgi:hypothetical protein